MWPGFFFYLGGPPCIGTGSSSLPKVTSKEDAATGVAMGGGGGEQWGYAPTPVDQRVKKGKGLVNTHNLPYIPSPAI